MSIIRWVKSLVLFLETSLYFTSFTPSCRKRFPVDLIRKYLKRKKKYHQNTWKKRLIKCTTDTVYLNVISKRFFLLLDICSN